MVLAIEHEPRQRRQWARVVARAWDDDGFRQRLLAEPEAVLREAGIALPPGVPVRVVEDDAAQDTDTGACLRLPARPPADDLIEDELGVPPNAPAGGPFAYLCLTHSRSHFCHTGATGCRRSTA
jgi:hypothetical protein